MTAHDQLTLPTALRRRWAIWNTERSVRNTDATRAVEHATTGVRGLDPYARLWDYMFLGTKRPARRVMSGFLADDLELRRWADLTDAVRETYMTIDWSRHEDYSAFENVVAAAVETAARRLQGAT